jgi:hypothetical protein
MECTTSAHTSGLTSLFDGWQSLAFAELLATTASDLSVVEQ